MLRTIFITLAVLVVLIVGAVVALPFVIPTSVIVDRLTAQVETSTGRSFAVEGPVEVSLWPRLTVQVNDVEMGNVPNGQSSYLAQLERLDLDMAIIPLFSGSIEIDRFQLVGLDLALEQLADGTGNWMLGDDPAADPDSATADSSGSDAGGSDGLNNLQLGTFEIVDGRVSYSDLVTGARQVVDDINVTVELASLTSTLSLAGEAVYRGETVTLDVVLDTPASAMDDGSATFDMALSAPALSFTFNGGSDALTSFLLDGALTLETDLSDLAAWLDEVPADLPIDQVALQGTFAGADDGIELSDMRLTADEIVAEGLVGISTLGDVPLISARLGVGPLNLDRFLPPEDTNATAREAPAAGSTGWSDAPIDLSSLRDINLDVVANTDTITVHGVTLGPSQTVLLLQDGRLELQVADTALFGGTVSSALMLDGSASMPTLSLQSTATGIDAEPVLAQFAGTDRFAGTGNLELSVRSSGSTQRQMIGNLLGQAQFLFRDGSVRGINIAGLLRDPASVLRGGASGGPQQETDFAEFGASFSITDGIAQTSDITMLAPLFRVAGAGDIDLPERYINLLLDPRIAATIEGQGGQQEVAGIEIPVIVEGPFDAISFRPDMERLFRSMASDPAAMRQTIEQLRASFGVDGVGELDALLGGLDGAGVPGLDALLGGAGDGAAGTLTDVIGGALGGDGGGTAADQAIQGVLGNALGRGEAGSDVGGTAAEQAIQGVLGNVLGGQQPAQTPSPSLQAPAPTPEPSPAPAPTQLIEGLLGGGGNGGSSAPANPLGGLLRN